MSDFFIYTEKLINKKKDKNDPEKVILEEVELSHFFDIKRVIRGITTEPNEMIVLLDDGYESSEDAIDYNKTKPNSKPVFKRERTWKQSQIKLIGNDIARFLDFISQQKLCTCNKVNVKTALDEIARQGQELDYSK